MIDKRPLQMFSLCMILTKFMNLIFLFCAVADLEMDLIDAHLNTSKTTHNA